MRARLTPSKLIAYGMGLAAVAAAVGGIILAESTHRSFTQTPVLVCAASRTRRISWTAQAADPSLRSRSTRRCPMAARRARKAAARAA
jgi:hypothetical protein